MNVFGSNAVEIARHGVCVIPLGEGRRPCVGGWNRWSRPASLRTVEKWSQMFPNANLALVPGLSRVTVVDVDDIGDVSIAEKIFGATKLRVRSRRGVHLYYARTSARLPGDLRRWGIAADIKTGNNLIIAPPSVHESGAAYAFEAQSGWDLLRQLREPDHHSLRRFIDKTERPKPTGPLREMRDSSRRQWLNDELCRHAASCDSFDELLDVAQSMNSNLADRGIAPLEDAVVITRAQQVWADAQAGHIEQWQRRAGVARVSDDELRLLMELDTRGGPDAVAFLTKLRVEHTARCKRGETFAITPKAMQRANVMPGWSRERYERARDLLLLAGILEIRTGFINGYHGRRATQYRLSVSSDAGRAPIATG